jgi:hypothetical protein
VRLRRRLSQCRAAIAELRHWRRRSPQWHQTLGLLHDLYRTLGGGWCALDYSTKDGCSNFFSFDGLCR